MKQIFYILALLALSISTISCEEKEEATKYDDWTMTFEPSDQLKPVTDLAQELLNTDSLTAKFTAAGESAQKNLKLQLKENITDKQTSLTTFYLVDGKCYFGIDSIISAFASDEIDKSFLSPADLFLQDLQCLWKEPLHLAPD